MFILKLFLPTILYVFFADMIWLGFIAKGIYAEQIGGLLRRSGEQMTPIWSAAFVVYVAISLGIVIFVLPRANGDYLLAFIYGVAFGAVTYGIYDFTNLSILANWPLKITLIDFTWGMVLCGTASLFAAFVQANFSA